MGKCCRRFASWLPLVVAAMVPCVGQAQGKFPYKAVGAPSEPRVAARWNRYHDHAEATKLLKDLAAAYPHLAKLESLGKSYGEREMWVMTVGNQKSPHGPTRPAFWIDGGIHANEIQSVEVVLYTAWFLLESYDTNETIHRLLNERQFYLMPMMSPDSRDAHFYRPNTTHSPRGGQRPVDDDRDGLTDEDPADDIDGDGHITQMRVKDPNGRYKPHEDFPELMVRVADDEQGEYSLLGSEGTDNDGDGQVNEDGDGYYDPNRDWGWNWQPNYVQNGAHRYPFSIKENRLVADFIAARPHIAGAQTYHNTGGMILYGPGAKSDAYDRSDQAVYLGLAKQGEQLLPGYKGMNIAAELYEVYGGEIDWLHQMRGVFTFTNELFTPFNYFRKASSTGGFLGTSEERHLFNKYLLLDEGTVPWHEVDHPQYGKIEVGGMKKSWSRQPPSFLLEEECHRNMAFTLYHADQMPWVKVQSIDVEPLGEGLTQVTAIVENVRRIPTHSAIDVKHHITPEDRVTLTAGERDAEKPNVLLALSSSERYFQSPREHRRQPAEVRLKNIPGHDVVYVRWLVKGAGPFTVRVESTKGGKDEKTSGE